MAEVQRHDMETGEGNRLSIFLVVEYRGDFEKSDKYSRQDSISSYRSKGLFVQSSHIPPSSCPSSRSCIPRKLFLPAEDWGRYAPVTAAILRRSAPVAMTIEVSMTFNDTFVASANQRSIGGLMVETRFYSG